MKAPEKRTFSGCVAARLAEVSHVTLSQLERGLRADVTTATAKRIAQALNTSIDYLVGRF